MTGEAAISFDRDILNEYDAELGNVLHITDTLDRLVVAFPENMNEREKDNAHLILETMGFE